MMKEEEAEIGSRWTMHEISEIICKSEIMNEWMSSCDAWDKKSNDIIYHSVVVYNDFDVTYIQ